MNYTLELTEKQMKFVEVLLDRFLKAEGLLGLQDCVQFYNALKVAHEKRARASHLEQPSVEMSMPDHSSNQQP